MKERLDIPNGYQGAVRHYLSSQTPMYHVHRHDELELNLCTRGTAVCLVDNKRFDLKRGTLLWLFPEQNHVLIDRAANYEMWVLVWNERLLRSVCTTPESGALLNSQAPDSFCKILPEHQTERLHLLFQELCDAHQDRACFNAGLGYAALAAWGAYAADQRITPSFDVHPAVERAVRLIQAETTPLGLNELARRAGLSPARLSRLFKEQTGVSMVAYRNRERLRRFFSLYQRGRRKNVLAAALQAGFGSYTQFHRIFRKEVGFAPAMYRRKMTGLSAP